MELAYRACLKRNEKAKFKTSGGWRWMQQRGYQCSPVINVNGKCHLTYKVVWAFSDRPFTTKTNISQTQLRLTRDQLLDIKHQLNYLYWLLESLSRPAVHRPPSTLLMSIHDDEFPSPVMAEGYWYVVYQWLKCIKFAEGTTLSNTTSAVDQQCGIIP